MNRKTADAEIIVDEDNQPTEWMQRPWVRVRESEDPQIAALLEAAREVRPVWIRYHGGSDAGGKRRILPAVVFGLDGDDGGEGCPVYIVAWCALRQAPRLFRSDRIESVRPCQGSSVAPFPFYRALGEIERELRERYAFEDDDLEILRFDTAEKNDPKLRT
ncbi:MAG: WYL domain-containing protein [Puniceicoccaceae bacterium]